MSATTYLLKWCPFNEQLLIHATWLDFERRLKKSFNSVAYFVHRFSAFFDGINIDKLNEEFIHYQLLSSNDIPASIKEGANLCEEDPHRIDILWGIFEVSRSLEHLKPNLDCYFV